MKSISNTHCCMIDCVATYPNANEAGIPRTERLTRDRSTHMLAMRHNTMGRRLSYSTQRCQRVEKLKLDQQKLIKRSRDIYIPVTSSKEPMVNCEFLPTDGWKGEAAAASQTSSSGDDMNMRCELREGIGLRRVTNPVVRSGA